MRNGRELVRSALLESDKGLGTVPYSGFPSQVEVDCEALAANARWIKARVGPAVALMAVVKANAYGHGALRVARIALENGAQALAVANIEEAAELRQAGIAAPILLLSVIHPGDIARAIALGLSVTLYDSDMAETVLAAAQGSGGRLSVHIKIDSGMGRLGLSVSETPQLCRRLHASGCIRLDGIYTHFSSADADPRFTALQLRRFKQVLADLRAQEIRFKYVHSANSAAVISCRDSYFNLARAGLLLYGLNPLPQADAAPGLRPALAWRTRIAQVKTLPPASPVGYGNSYHTRGTETIAVLPVGYADGLRRSPQTWRYVLVHGQRAPLVGRVSMEKAAINVSHIQGVRADDEVVLLGVQGDDEISADDIALWLDTINYEVVTALAPRAPRTYFQG